jgi:DNA-binding NarL/FixJ family response regulator
MNHDGRAASPTTVLIVDDQDLVRTGLEMIVGAAADLEVVGQAADGGEAVREAQRLRPDVVLMDVRMPTMDGIEATRQILATCPDPGPRVLMLTTFDLDDYVFEAFAAGASGFLVKDAARQTILDGIRAIALGEGLASPSVTRRLIERVVAAPAHLTARPRVLDDLTPREHEVFVEIAQGHSNPEIAIRLFLSEKTVKTHVGRILMKLGVRDRVQAVVLAYEAGVVVPGREP